MAMAKDDMNYLRDSDGYFTEPSPVYSLKFQHEIWRLKYLSVERAKGFAFGVGFEDKSTFGVGVRTFKWIISVYGSFSL